MSLLSLPTEAGGTGSGDVAAEPVVRESVPTTVEDRGHKINTNWAGELVQIDGRIGAVSRRPWSLICRTAGTFGGRA